MIKPKVIAGMSVYNEEANMVPCLESVKDFIDGICLVDGTYFGYPGKDKISTDKTREVTLKWCSLNGKQFHIIECFDYRQKDKRTRYLQNPCHKPDENTWIFVLDPDNRFIQKPNFKEKFIKHATQKNKYSGNGWMYNYLAIGCDESQLHGSKRGPLPKAILLRYEPGLKYQPNHWTVSDVNNKLYCMTNQSKTKVLPAYVKNLPLDVRNWKRKWDRAGYRAIRLLCAPNSWGNNLFEKGSGEPAHYIESEEDLQIIIDKLQIKLDTEVRDLDMGIMSMLQWYKSGSLREPPIMGEMQRGQTIGLLMAFGLIPDPHS